MAERSQYQYTQLVGPVWSEPVASRLAWLPRVQQPARGLPPNRLGDFVRPEFEALYKAEGLQWSPSDRYFGRAIPRELTRWYVVDPIPPASPQHLTWVPVDRYSGKPLPRSQRDFTIWPPFEPLYDPENLQWIPSDRYAGRALVRSPYDSSVLVQLVTAAAFDPQTLDWMPRGTAPQVPLEKRRTGDFQQPPFSALYDPQRLEWTPSDRYAGRALQRALNDQSVLVQFVTAPVFDPQNLDWQPRDRYFGRQPARALVDWSVFQGEPLVEPPPVIVPVAETPFSGGSRKKVRGPYSDPRIYKAYIARCIAEREKPRINLEVALVKEALVEEVEERRETGYAEYDALIRENQLLQRLLALEHAKRNLAAITARQRQIAKQIEDLEDDQTRSIITLLDEM